MVPEADWRALIPGASAAALTWLMLQFVGPLQKAMGKLISQVFSKVLALFIAAIGINMVLKGVSVYFRTLHV